MCLTIGKIDYDFFGVSEDRKLGINLDNNEIIKMLSKFYPTRERKLWNICKGSRILSSMVKHMIIQKWYTLYETILDSISAPSTDTSSLPPLMFKSSCIAPPST